MGTARAQWDDETFRRHISEQLAEHAADVPREHRDALARSLRYRSADLTDADDVAALISLAGDGPVAAYLALPPGLYGATVTALGGARLPAGSRVALEKPFGDSLEDAVALNQLVTRAAGEAGEQAIFRVDHALGMVTVQNLLALRRHDPLLAAAWDAEHIEQVEVRWEEDLALEGRAAYYDGAGALKDVMQNHMLQVLCVLAMEPPAGPGEHELRDAKAATLRAARAPGPDAVGARTRRARYVAGHIGNRAVPAYVDEEGVDPDRGTETFAEVVLEIDTPRWRGTRFVLRAGKALARAAQGGGRAVPCHRARRRAQLPAVRHRRPARCRPAAQRHGADDPDRVAARLGSAPVRPRPARSPRRRQHALGARRRGRGGLARARAGARRLA